MMSIKRIASLAIGCIGLLALLIYNLTAGGFSLYTYTSYSHSQDTLSGRVDTKNLPSPISHITISPSANSPPTASASTDPRPRTLPCEPRDRLATLKQMCSMGLEHRINNLTSMYSRHRMNLYVNDRYKYVACLPPKTGCTTWKTILANNTVPEALSADFDGEKLHITGLTKYGIKRLKNYNTTEQARILDSYYKFMVVRHPLDRLLSAHRDKLVLGNQRSPRTHLINFMKSKYKKENDTSLQAFLLYMSESHTNPHWYPYTGLCDPCNISYDKIIKLETQERDKWDVLPHLGPYGRANPVHANRKREKYAGDKFRRILSEYDPIADAVLSQALEAAGFDIDAKLFGYKWKWTKDYRVEIECSSNRQCC